MSVAASVEPIREFGLHMLKPPPTRTPGRLCSFSFRSPNPLWMDGLVY